MDLETEDRIVAADLRRQAEKEGVRAYLKKPNVRHRPNSKFLTATILGVQQSNKAVETNETWRVRKKEESSKTALNSSWRLDKRCGSGDEKKMTTHGSSSSDKRWHSEDDQGLRDDEIESFLQSRIKRGRGSVGPRMDETGPYLPVEKVDKLQSCDTREQRVVLGPERPPSLRLDRIRKKSMKNHTKKDKKTLKKRKRDRH